MGDVLESKVLSCIRADDSDIGSAWIIEKIKEMERKRRQKDDRIPVYVPDPMPPPDYVPDKETPQQDPDRGVVTIDLKYS
jgi:hypothetical protein